MGFTREQAIDAARRRAESLTPERRRKIASEAGKASHQAPRVCPACGHRTGRRRFEMKVEASVEEPAKTSREIEVDRRAAKILAEMTGSGR